VSARLHSRSCAAGFTLLEALVATLIMGVAVTALLANLSTSLRNASKLTDYDRAAMIARTRMNELLLDENLAVNTPLQGRFDPAATGWTASGWIAQASIFEKAPGAAPGQRALERIGLEIWWDTPAGRRNFRLEGFRKAVLRPEDVLPQ
jgi:type II secretory pathway pseudopilin PulG